MEITHNNNESMKTVVETFVIEETAGLIYDNEQLEKWSDMVTELGLTGQTKIVKPDKSPIPFMHMKQGMVSIFETLCPRKVDLSEYDKTPIPVEILDLIALSKKEGYFQKMQIWYDDKSPDPACVGITSEFYLYHYEGVPKEAKSAHYPTKQDALTEIRKYNAGFKETSSFGWLANETHYLLGKWGDVKMSLEELREKAMKRHMESRGAEFRKQIKEAQRGLDDLEAATIEKFT